jgi:endonuclease YncB( thermonuclease family)
MASAFAFTGSTRPKVTRVCQRDAEAYRCGQQAALALADTVGAKTVRCEGRDRDRYGRTVAVCFVGTEDIAAWMVRQGWALAFRKYSIAYVHEEDEARAARLGIWQGEFTAPWEWRAARRLAHVPPR